VADGVDPGMVEVVRWHIYDTLARTTEDSTLPEEEQNALLAQACVEACDVLGRWVKSQSWEKLRESGEGTVADVIPDLKRVRPFLDPLKETLNRISEEGRKGHRAPDIGDAEKHIDRAIAAVGYTGRRYRRLSQIQLFDQATQRVNQLRDSVCELAREFKKDLDRHADDQQKRAKRKKRAWILLKKVAPVLLTVSLAMAGASPAAMRQNIPEWGHDAVKVLLVHHVAETAQPSVRIAPPHVGPHLG
jgi:hypothetical protein